ncbi:MAG: 23S rRNA (uracil-C(5))-methyltransferase RlmCD [Candidatus Anoxychlamydiales bacterium]|nr:23S rRNA (uracil-C(5))-methyltransferase RlmCD [Candidatus Anoxychlamydiales bacterium]
MNREKKVIIKELTIEKFSQKGKAIAYDEKKNKIVITNAVIEDVILAELNKKKNKGIIKGRILEILKPSTYREDPKCKHFDICGGCIWQNIKYLYQLEQKQNFLIDTFQDFIKKTNVEMHPIIKSKNIFEYRNKMEFSFSQNRKKTKFLGLIMKGGRFVIDIQRCFLANIWFSKVLVEVKNWWEKYDFDAFNYYNGEGFLKNLTIKEGKNTQDKMVILTVSDSYTLNDEEKKDFIDHVLKSIIPDKKISIFFNTQISKKGVKTTFNLQKLYGNDFIKEDLNINALGKKIKLSFQIGPNSFFQPNTHMAEILYTTAINYLEKQDIKDKTALDLYSGTGTIAMILSKFVKKVLAIELSENACSMAKDNMKLNNIKNFEMINGDVSKILPTLLSNKNFEKPHIVVVDPPRSGLSDEAIENILKIYPEIIIYISCNINTQLDNIKVLTEKNYQLKVLHPIDQFPHTFHIENIAILKKT